MLADISAAMLMLLGSALAQSVQRSSSGAISYLGHALEIMQEK
jgi:hypothetical protein